MSDILALPGVVMSVVMLPGTLYLTVLTLAGLMRPRSVSGRRHAGRIAIVVPAHNESRGIARTLESLLAEARRDGHADVVVIADNCDDDTAEVAARCGAFVLVREDAGKRGKGYALDYAFNALAQSQYFACVVVDADSVVSEAALDALRQQFADGAEAVQIRYAALLEKPGMASLALSAFNMLRPRGRDRLGLSAGILGNGFALRCDLLRRVPYTAASIVEDLEYHLKLVAAGVRVTFCDSATVFGEMPDTRRAARSQRARWEGGRLRMLLDHAAPLSVEILNGQWRLAEPLAELMLPPLALHVALLGVLACLPGTLPLLVGILGLSAVVLHVLAAARIGGISAAALFRIGVRVPAYLLWKLSLIPLSLRSAKRETAWVRTERNPESMEAQS